MKKDFILESIYNAQNIVEQDDGKGSKKYIISGPFTLANTPNANNRIYPKETLNKAIAKFREKVSKKRIKMSLDHPEWEGKLSNTAAILLEVSDVKDDNMAYYKAQITDTSKGKDLKAILDAGGMVGVSTRGRSRNCMYDQEWPGLPGRYTIIGEDLELCNVDFVEEPSVEETEAQMQLENIKRSEDMPKTLEELKKENPEVFEGIEKTFDSEKSKLNTLVEEANKKLTSITENFNKLVTVVKELKPELFTVIPESEIISKKESEIKKLSEEIENMKTKLSESDTNLKKLVDEKEKIEKEKFIESLKNTDADYFKFNSLVKLFDACANSEEVKKVYETHKELVKTLRSEANTPATAKTETPEAKKPEITEAQKQEFEFVNSQRMAVGLKAYTMEEFLKKISK
jgi:hypothetical protein